MSLPPSNQRTCGGVQSMTRVHGSIQSSACACSAQKSSGSAAARA